MQWRNPGGNRMRPEERRSEGGCAGEALERRTTKDDVRRTSESVTEGAYTSSLESQTRSREIHLESVGSRTSPRTPGTP